MQYFERQMGIFNCPERVTGIKTDADEVRPGFFYEHPQFSCLHVSGVIFNCDFDAEICGLRTRVMENANHIGDVGLDWSGSPVIGATQDAADDFRAHDLRRIEHLGKLLLGRTLLRIEHLGARADGSHSDLDFDLQCFGMLAYLPQMIGLEIADEAHFGEMHDLHFPGGAIVEIFERRPLLAAEAKQVDTQLYGRGRFSHGNKGSKGGCGKKTTAVHGNCDLNSPLRTISKSSLNLVIMDNDEVE